MINGHRTGEKCDECGSALYWDHLNELVCTECGLVHEGVSWRAFTVHYNPKLSNEELPSYGHLSDEELKSMVGEENYKRIRRINNPKENPALENLKKLALGELTSPNYQKIMKRESRTWNGKPFTDLVWNVYWDQIERYSSPSYDLWLEQKKVEHAYHELWGKEEYRELLETPANSPYQPWHWWLIKLRTPIKKYTGLDYKAVDRALNRLAKKRVRQMRISHAAMVTVPGWYVRPYSWPGSSADCWQGKLASIGEKRTKFGRDWLRHDALSWTTNFYAAVDAEWRGCGDTTWPHWRRYANEIFSSSNEDSR